MKKPFIMVVQAVSMQKEEKWAIEAFSRCLQFLLILKPECWSINTIVQIVLQFNVANEFAVWKIQSSRRGYINWILWMKLSDEEISDPKGPKDYRCAWGLAWNFNHVYIGVDTNNLRTSPKINQKPIIYLKKHETNHLGLLICRSQTKVWIRGSCCIRKTHQPIDTLGTSTHP